MLAYNLPGKQKAHHNTVGAESRLQNSKPRLHRSLESRRTMDDTFLEEVFLIVTSQNQPSFISTH